MSKKTFIPKSILLVSRVNFDAVLHAPMVRHMQKHYGSEFTILVGSQRRKEQWYSWLGDSVRIVIEPELTEGSGSAASVADEVQSANRREAEYGITFMRHIFHQDKGTAAVMLQHTPGSAFAKSKLPPYVDMVSSTNRHFDFIEELHAQRPIDLIIARNSGLFNSAAIAFARAHGIPSVWLNHLRTGKRMTWMEGPDHSDHYVRGLMKDMATEDVVPPEEIVPPADTVWALNRISNEYRWRSVARQLLVLGRNTVGHLIEDIKRGKRGKRLSSIASAKNILQKRKIIKYLHAISNSDVDELCREPFVLFLLHLDPEYTSSTLSRDFNHVHAVVQQLALSLPVGMKLVIKEHVWGLGNRRRDFYEDLMHLPNVVFADYRIRSTILAEKASLVSAVTGTIVLEASMLGKPVVTFTPRSEYSNLPNVHVVEDVSKLTECVADALEERDEDAVLAAKREAATFRAAQTIASFDLPELELYADGNAARDLPIDAVSEETVSNAVDLLLKVVDSQLTDKRP